VRRASRTYSTSSFLARRIFRVLLGSDGAINWLLLYSGVIAEPISGLLYSRSAVVIALVYVWIPFAALPISAALQRIDPELVEAAVDLGAAPVYLFGQLRFASRLPMMIAFAVLMIMGTLLLVLIAEWIRRRGRRGIVR